jgi:hypothetical protein
MHAGRLVCSLLVRVCVECERPSLVELVAQDRRKPARREKPCCARESWLTYEGRPSPEDIMRVCVGAAWVSCCTLAPINGCVTKAFGEPRVTGTPAYGAGAGGWR